MKNIWSEIRDEFCEVSEEGSVITIDAWLTEDDNEEGKVIAKVSKESVEYIDERAKTDIYAQQVINGATAYLVEFEKDNK